MRNIDIFNKYLKGSHWIDHTTAYSEHFSKFLVKKKFKGTIVDLGCGIGRDVNMFKSKKFKIIGIDISKEILKKAETRYPDCDFELGDVQKLKTKNSSVDAVFMINVIHYVVPSVTLGEVWRILKPGGFLFIHFNLSITDADGIVDYTNSKNKIQKLIASYNVIEENELERVDERPIEHTHKILELILQKPKK